jgi:hypothetical protein
MANVDLKVGEYTIAPLSTNTFTFWWPIPPGHLGSGLKSFFDVSIMPEPNQVDPTITPLVEVKRERGVQRVNRQTVPTLHLTLQNNNDVPVKFYASHIHVE